MIAAVPHYSLLAAPPLLALVRSSLRVGIVGAHGYLGRELLSQSLERGITPLPFVRRNDPIRYPPPLGWLDPKEEDALPFFESIPMYSTNLTGPVPAMDGIVFVMSGRPFQKDTTTQVVEHFCSNLPLDCKKVCLVSAWGVGESIEGSNLGIKAMRAWYLKSVYHEKERQERIVSELPAQSLILRPKVLSFSTVPLNPISTPRKDVAATILKWMEADAE